MNGVKKIVIEIDKKEISLTLEQAKNLRDELNNLMSHSNPIYIPYYIQLNNPLYNYPKVVYCSSDISANLGNTQTWTISN